MMVTAAPPVDVFQTLAKQDSIYSIKLKHIGKRVRVWKITKCFDDPATLVSRPWRADDELPYVFSFGISQGQLVAVDSKESLHKTISCFAIEKLDTNKFAFINSMCMFDKEFTYMQAQLRSTESSFIAINSGMSPSSADWQPAQLEHLFYDPVAVTS